MDGCPSRYVGPTTNRRLEGVILASAGTDPSNPANPSPSDAVVENKWMGL